MGKLLQAVVLDGYTLNPGDLDWKPLESTVNLTVFDRTPAHQVIERAAPADIIILNKVRIGEAELKQLPDLKAIFILATGYDNVDIKAAAKRHIPVHNVSGYSTESVAQHVFALIFALTNKVELHHQSVQAGKWSQSPDFSYTLAPIPELAGKKLGILGFGKIGKRVAEIGQAFEMEILVTRRSLRHDRIPGVNFVDQQELFAQSDILSLHIPLTDQTNGIVNKANLGTMKKGAILINTGRGGLIIDQDLKEALESGQIAGAALDVLREEPPAVDHILLGVANCLITPHIAWAGFASRKRLLEETAINISAYLKGTPRNQVNE
ncbi:MAG: D-2-hydroxyacid dehydrogenase [Saprospiraceae bacterium]|nr:D-2-hydroxyacid dehydrogenase [Saprospiraceae bacterium]